MNNQLKKIPISEIFFNTNYIVPIYQRNYAWDETQIIQLIEDIESSIESKKESYFLGNLIVNQRGINSFEVIDGQQRLTTLYLLKKYLEIDSKLEVSFEIDSLRFEARDKSNETLSFIGSNNFKAIPSESSSPEIIRGFHIIKNYFKNKTIDKSNFYKKLTQVFLIRIQVPENIDLNHYFEIMNTRGEQLELHEIVKAKLLEVLETGHDKNIGAIIWEKCSDMNSYIQMNFDSKTRSKIFSSNWSNLGDLIKDFDSLKIQLEGTLGTYSEDKTPLLEILENNIASTIPITISEEENERFESTISFPNFLLQVNAILKNLKEEDSSLDDKNFLGNLSWTWKTSDNSKHFLFHLLKCRVLFDKYVLKREFARDYKESGKWSLQRLESYYDNNTRSYKPKYISTFDKENNKLKTLQSCLRITYTSPKTMHWITILLSNLLANEVNAANNISTLLEDYCKQKVAASEYENNNGFDIERIVFTYLDYLIYRDGYSYNNKEIISPLSENWNFQFRNSIEHFYPQNPTELESWDNHSLNSFGNLGLITVSGNSKFSNLLPNAKISSFPSVVNQSLKLKIMKEMTEMEDGNWTKEKSNIHKDEMFKILKS